jgi:hypothetical protein
MVCQQAEKQRCVETISEWPEESRKGDHPVKSILKQPSSNDDSTSHIKCSISFSEDIDTVEIPALDDDMLDDMFYLEAEIANFKYEAFMEEAGLNASDFEGSSTNSGTSATDLDGSLSFNNTDCSSNSFQERENLASSGSKSQPRGPERSSTKASTLQSEKTIGLLSGFKSKRTMSASEGLDEMDISNRSGRQISASGRLDASNISLHDDPGETKNSVRTKVEMPLLSVGDPRTQATEAKSSRGTTKSIRISRKIDVIPKPKQDGDGDECGQAPTPPQTSRVRSSWASHGPSKTATRSPTLLKCTLKTTSPQSYSISERDSPMPKNVYIQSKFVELSPLAPPSPLSSPRPSPSPRMASIAVQASPSLPLCPPLSSPRLSPSPTTESRKLQASSVPLSSPLSSLCVRGETKMSLMTKKRYSTRVEDVLKLSPESSEVKGKVEMPLLSVGDPRTQATEAKSSRGTTKSKRIRRKSDFIPKPKPDGNESGQAPTPLKKPSLRSSWVSQGPPKTAARSPTLLKYTPKTTSFQTYSIPERDSPMPKSIYIRSKSVEISPLAPPSPLSSPRPSPSPRMASIAVQASASLPLCPPLPSPRPSPSPTTKSMPLSSPLSSLFGGGETKKSAKTNKITKKRHSKRVEDIRKLSPESSEVKERVEMPLSSTGDPRTEASETRSSNGTTKSIRIRRKRDFFPKPKEDGDESGQAPTPPQTPPVRSSWVSHGPPEAAARSPTLLKYTPKTTSPQSYSIPERDSPTPKTRSKSVKITPLAPPSPLSSPRPSPSPRMASTTIRASPSLPLCPPLSPPKLSPSPTTGSRKHQTSSMPMSSPLSSPRPSPSPRTAARAPYGSFEYGLCSTSSPPQLSYASIASDTVTSGPLSMAVLKYIDSPRGRAYRSHRDKARAIHSQRRLMAEHRNAIM